MAKTSRAREFFAAMRIQKRVIGALVRRDLSARHGGDVASNLWMFFEPIGITLLVLAFHWGTTGGVVNSVPVVAFLLTGFTPHLLLRHSGLAGITAINSNVGLLYHQRIHFLDLVIARLLGEIGFILASFVTMYAIFYVAGYLRLPYSLAYIYLGWFFHIWFVFAVCLLFAGLGLIWELSRRIFMPLTYAMIPVYGAFFMMSWLPENIRNILLYFPPANATEIMRFGYFGTTQATYFFIPYTAACCTALTFVALLVLFRSRQRLEF
jgi:ABC-type polysaccharide/polyol phosphate export permease